MMPQHPHPLLKRNKKKVKKKRRRRRKRRKLHPHHHPKKRKKIWIWEIYSVDLYHLYPINFILFLNTPTYTHNHPPSSI